MSTQITAIDWDEVGAIVFDYGNVLIDLDNTLYDRRWPDDLFNDNQAFEQWAADENLWLDYEKGKIPTSKFLSKLGENTGLSPKQITDHWNSILIGINPKRFETLISLQQQWPLYVLSNTNDIHIQWVREHVKGLGVADFETRFFEEVFYSYELGFVKPEAGIYEAVEKGIGLPEELILFVDDKAENVAAARARGWQAVELQPGTPVETIFKSVLF